MDNIEKKYLIPTIINKNGLMANKKKLISEKSINVSKPKPG